ncbi:hypothetical protein IU422_09895 [Nocardia farcinica]|nr:hypothetical protein [Nocardia farcinica]
MRIELYQHYTGSAAEQVVGTCEVSDAPVAQARRLFDDRVRKVAFTEPVPLADGSSRHVLDLLRELAAWGVHVDWRASGSPADWPQFSHLPPPTSADGSVDLGAWRAGFFPGKCVFREGPGFIQIRDRRRGALDCYTVDEPALMSAIRELSGGAEPRSCEPDAVEQFLEYGLLVRAGQLQWWAPARVRRWPVPAMVA